MWTCNFYSLRINGPTIIDCLILPSSLPVFVCRPCHNFTKALVQTMELLILKWGISQGWLVCQVFWKWQLLALHKLHCLLLQCVLLYKKTAANNSRFLTAAVWRLGHTVYCYMKFFSCLISSWAVMSCSLQAYISRVIWHVCVCTGVCTHCEDYYVAVWSWFKSIISSHSCESDGLYSN